MQKFGNEPLLDDATLKRLDEEYLAGNFEKLSMPELPLLDPRTDPFGMNYEWLGPPAPFIAEVPAENPKDK